MAWGLRPGLTYQMNLLDLFPKSITLPISLPIPLGSLITIRRCSWLSMIATIANDGVRVAPRIVEGIYGNNDKGGLGDLIQQLQPTEMNKGQYIRLRL